MPNVKQTRKVQSQNPRRSAPPKVRKQSAAPQKSRKAATSDAAHYMQCATNPTASPLGPACFPDGSRGHTIPVDHLMEKVLQPSSAGRIAVALLPTLPGGLAVLEAKNVGATTFLKDATPTNMAPYTYPWPEYSEQITDGLHVPNIYSAEEARLVSMGMDVLPTMTTLKDQGSAVLAKLPLKYEPCVGSTTQQIISAHGFEIPGKTVTEAYPLVQGFCVSSTEGGSADACIVSNVQDLARLPNSTTFPAKERYSAVSVPSTCDWHKYCSGTCCPRFNTITTDSSNPTLNGIGIIPWRSPMSNPWTVPGGHYGDGGDQALPLIDPSTVAPLPLRHGFSVITSNEMLIYVAEGLDPDASIAFRVKACWEYNVSPRSAVKQFVRPAPRPAPAAIEAVRETITAMPAAVPSKGWGATISTVARKIAASLSGSANPILSAIGSLANGMMDVFA